MKNTTIKSLITLLVFSLILSGCSLAKKDKIKILTLNEAKIKTEQFINDNLMKSNGKAIIKTITEESGLYKTIVDIGRKEDIDSYITKDGKIFFPQVMNIDEVEKENKQQKTETNQQDSTPLTVNKTDKPKVEMFVMSYCPYGIQIEKGIIPVIETLKDKIDFELKFCDYLMHEKKELDEQLLQYCVQKQGSNKVINYLKCFLKDGKSKECVSAVGVNDAVLNLCITTTDKEYRVTEQYNNRDTWKNGNFPVFDVYKKDNEKYKIAGSPSLVINGSNVSSGRSAAELLKTICAGFNNPPEECKIQLSSTKPSTGFGFKATSGDDKASCN